MNIRKKYWLQVSAWILLIYSTLYIIQPITDYLQEHTPFELLTTMMIVAVLISILSGYVLRWGAMSFSGVILTSIIFGCYLYGLYRIRFPAEKIHFLEYGFLAFLIYRALRLDIRRFWAYAGALVLTALFGWIDEGIQHLLPNRYYELVDVRLNGISAALALSLVYIFERERMIKGNKKFW